MDELLRERVARFEFLGRHLLKRSRKFRRRVEPLVRRIQRERDALRARAGKQSADDRG